MSHKKRNISPGPLQTQMSTSKPQHADGCERISLLSMGTNSPRGCQTLLACDGPRDDQMGAGMAQHS